MEQMELPFSKDNQYMKYDVKKQEFVIKTRIAQEGNIETCTLCIMHCEVPPGEQRQTRGYCMFLQKELTFTNIYVSRPEGCPLKTDNEIQINNTSTNDELPVTVIKPSDSVYNGELRNLNTENSDGQGYNIQPDNFSDGFYTIDNRIVDEINSKLIRGGK